MKILLLLAALSFQIPAKAEIIRVSGVEVDARNIQYFTGSQNIHSFSPVTPTQLPLARGQTILAADTVYLFPSGKISAIYSSEAEEINWRFPDGRILPLTCGPKKSFMGDISPRLTSFHENGEYRTGCSTSVPFDFSAGNNQIIQAFGDIDLDANLYLAYATKVANSSVVAGNNNNKVRLFTGSEIAFHSAGKPNFFTMNHGEKFSVNQGTFGEINFIQKDGPHASTSLFADGTVERGILGQEIIFPEFKLPLPAGTGVGFTQEDGKLLITIAILPKPGIITADGIPVAVNRIAYNPEIRLYEALTAEIFTFRSPEGRLMDIPAGSIVVLSATGAIFSIEARAASVPFKRNQLSL